MLKLELIVELFNLLLRSLNDFFCFKSSKVLFALAFSPIKHTTKSQRDTFNNFNNYRTFVILVQLDALKVNCFNIVENGQSKKSIEEL